MTGFIESWLPPPPARVLEVGCGKGALTRRLAGAGYRVLGIDPAAPDEEWFERTTLEELDPGSRFDAVVAIRSLHHVHDLDAAADKLRALLKPPGRLVLFEFAVENVDPDARRWLAGHGLEGEFGSDFHDVHPLADLRAALGQRFQLLADEPGGYLARDLGREELHAEEEAAISRGELRAAGARLVYELSPGLSKSSDLITTGTTPAGSSTAPMST